MIEIWYAIVAFMLVMFVVLDGMDLGAGMLQPLVGKTEAERRLVIAAIGPLWSWHEVWLVSFGGTLFVAFPNILAVSFSGFYLALFLLLWGLVGRGISIEFGGHIKDPLWRTGWNFAFVGSNILLAILIGAALGNVVRGVPLDASGKFAMAFFTNFSPFGQVGILDWFTVSVAVFTLVTFAAHGANALVLKTEGPVRERSLRLGKLLWKAVVLLLVIVTIETWRVRPELFSGMKHQPFAWLGLVLVVRRSAGGVHRVVRPARSAGHARLLCVHRRVDDRRGGRRVSDHAAFDACAGEFPVRLPKRGGGKRAGPRPRLVALRADRLRGLFPVHLQTLLRQGETVGRHAESLLNQLKSALRRWF